MRLETLFGSMFSVASVMFFGLLARLFVGGPILPYEISVAVIAVALVATINLKWLSL